MKQTNIKISKYVRDQLDEIDGGTFDSKLNNLIDIVECEMPFVEYGNQRTNIKTNTDTLEKLDKFRITSTESRDNIITRMLIAYDEINNTVSHEEWISFKLTNKYNNLLVLEGQMNYDTQDLSFNFRDNVYFNKLPSTYIVNGKDLTKELYIWYDNLNWYEIIKKLMDNAEYQRVLEETDYVLEINDRLI